MPTLYGWPVLSKLTVLEPEPLFSGPSLYLLPPFLAISVDDSGGRLLLSLLVIRSRLSLPGFGRHS
jgi:hypothetical protein